MEETSNVHNYMHNGPQPFDHEPAVSPERGRASWGLVNMTKELMGKEAAVMSDVAKCAAYDHVAVS